MNREGTQGYVHGARMAEIPSSLMLSLGSSKNQKHLVHVPQLV